MCTLVDMIDYWIRFDTAYQIWKNDVSLETMVFMDEWSLTNTVDGQKLSTVVENN